MVRGTMAVLPPGNAVAVLRGLELWRFAPWRPRRCELWYDALRRPQLWVVLLCFPAAVPVSSCLCVAALGVCMCNGQVCLRLDVMRSAS